MLHECYLRQHHYQILFCPHYGGKKYITLLHLSFLCLCSMIWECFWKLVTHDQLFSSTFKLTLPSSLPPPAYYELHLGNALLPVCSTKFKNLRFFTRTEFWWVTWCIWSKLCALVKKFLMCQPIESRYPPPIILATAHWYKTIMFSNNWIISSLL